MELILSLVKLWLASFLNSWSDDVDTGKVPPVYISLIYFSISMGLLSLSLISTVPTTKLFCGACGCHACLLAIVYKITNDHKTYCEETSWLGFMTKLISLTGIIMLLMDYENTKTVANGFIFGYAVAVIRDMKIRRDNKTS